MSMQFSVVIPTCNRSRKLARALASVSAQTEPPAEIIVVDDASSPEELENTRSLVKAAPAAHCMALAENQGAATARNAGVARAQGAWIAFLDSDDWWAPSRLAAHRRIIEAAGNLVLTYNAAHVIRRSGAAATGTVGRHPPGRWRPEVALAAWNFIGGCSSVCVRKAAFEASGGFRPDLPSCQDWELWQRIVALGPFAHVDGIGTCFDIGPHRRISTEEVAVKAGHEIVHARAIQVPRTPAERRFVTAEHICTEAEIERRFHRRSPAAARMLRAFLTRPSARIAKCGASLALSLLRGAAGG